MTVQIKHLGAELCSLKSQNGTEYIWEGNPAFWGKHSPILFPIVGSLKNNTYTSKGQRHYLNRHGFAREMVFSLVENTADCAIFSLFSTPETKKVYPFDFELQIRYSLDASKLNIDCKVINTNDFTMPFSIGAHPAFALAAPFDEYSLEFEEHETLQYHLLDNGLISRDSNSIELLNSKLKLTYQLFERDALIFKTLQSRTIQIVRNDKPIVKVNFNGFPNLGLWTMKNAPFICIEPWYGYSDTQDDYDDFSDKEGLQLLGANQLFTSNYSIEIL